MIVVVVEDCFQTLGVFLGHPKTSVLLGVGIFFEITGRG